MKLIIQIPCYNEAETLEIALNDLPKHIDGIDEIEYLIINDGSKDNTVEVAKNWGVNYVVNFKKNKGLAKGFMAAYSRDMTDTQRGGVSLPRCFLCSGRTLEEVFIWIIS